MPCKFKLDLCLRYVRVCFLRLRIPLRQTTRLVRKIESRGAYMALKHHLTITTALVAVIAGYSTRRAYAACTVTPGINLTADAGSACATILSTYTNNNVSAGSPSPYHPAALRATGTGTAITASTPLTIDMSGSG